MLMILVDACANALLVGLKIATTLVTPRREGFQLQVAAVVTVALMLLQPVIVLPSCKNSTVPAVATPTVSKVADPYPMLGAEVRTAVFDCSAVVNVTVVVSLTTELYSEFPAMVAITLHVPVVPVDKLPVVIEQPVADPPEATA